MYKNKEKQREYQKNWMRERRENFFKDKKCIVCGSSDHLVLHHNDSSMKEEHRIWSWSRKRFDAEMSKCSVMCQVCHNKLHANQRKKHGRSRYFAGCRCPICVKAQNDYNRKYQRIKRMKRFPRAV